MNFSTDLKEILGQENVKENEPLREYTTFHTGGPADYFLTPEDIGGLLSAMDYLKDHGIPMFILGRGSNLLVSDARFRGAVVSMRRHMNVIRVYGNTIVAEAGAMLKDVSREALNHGLTGLEFASGIPGTVGGGLVMNAGAYGSELSDVVRMATAILPSGDVMEYTKEELDLSYRHSIFSDNDETVLSVEFVLKPGKPEEIREKMDELNRRRREKQPLELASAGSTFKRPEGYFAGALIEDAGLRGFRKGDAGVSEKHAGFVVNYGNATAAEIYEMILYVQRRVFDKSGVRLQREVKLLGEFPEGMEV